MNKESDTSWRTIPSTEFYYGLTAMDKGNADFTDYTLRIESLILKITKMPQIMKNGKDRKTRMQELSQPQPCGFKHCSFSLQT